jgi:hypothetical protein
MFKVLELPTVLCGIETWDLQVQKEEVDKVRQQK